MSSTNSDTDFDDVLRVLIQEKGLINDDVPSIDVFNFDYFDARMKSLNEAFPEPFFNHALAIKANCMRAVLKRALEFGKMGAECASISEVLHAIQCGFPAEKVIFDSPCKSKADIKTALSLGVVINMDNDVEIDIVDKFLKKEFKDDKQRIFGLRINPVVGGGNIPEYNTATRSSKFGLPLTEETKTKLLDLYKQYKWLNSIHFHVGSQGNPIDLFINASKIMLGFVDEIEKTTARNLTAIDIGGGLSFSYFDVSEPTGFSYSTYRRLLEEAVPSLFSGKYMVITEFGGSLTLKAGKSITRIETIKHWLPDLNPMILTHLGYNQFSLMCLLPEKFSHRFSIAGSDGQLKREGKKVVYNVGGPLCNQGDILKRDLEIFEAKEHDLLIIHDTGAYVMVMYSIFNSILPSPVYGYSRNKDGTFQVVCIKERTTIEENLAFWGTEEPRNL